MQDDKILEVHKELYGTLVKKAKEPVDTSKDGVYVVETEEGSCIEIISNGTTIMCSFDFYNTLIDGYKFYLNKELL